MRAFIALPLPSPVREHLGRTQRELAASHADVKWVEVANLHVTLKFLGGIGDTQRQAVEEVLRALARDQASFLLRVEDLGAFPSVEAPRVVWAGIGEGREAVIAFAQALDEALGGRGFAREERPFAAHATLGRVRSSRNRRALTQAIQQTRWSPPAAWPAKTVLLYQSHLGVTGPQYDVLAEFPLSSPPVSP